MPRFCSLQSKFWFSTFPWLCIAFPPKSCFKISDWWFKIFLKQTRSKWNWSILTVPKQMRLEIVCSWNAMDQFSAPWQFRAISYFWDSSGGSGLLWPEQFSCVTFQFYAFSELTFLMRSETRAVGFVGTTILQFPKFIVTFLGYFSSIKGPK